MDARLRPAVAVDGFGRHSAGHLDRRGRSGTAEDDPRGGDRVARERTLHDRSRLIGRKGGGYIDAWVWMRACDQPWLWMALVVIPLVIWIVEDEAEQQKTTLAAVIASLANERSMIEVV